MPVIFLGMIGIACAQSGGKIVNWSSKVYDKGDGVYQILLTGTVAQGYHTYTITDELSATEIFDDEYEGCEKVAPLYQISEPVEETDQFGDVIKCFYDEIVVAFDVKLTSATGKVKGSIFTNSCILGECKAEYWDYEITVDPASALPLQDIAVSDAPEEESVVTGSEEKKGQSIWSLILEAILWGFAMLLTPCVFPMVPMTVSFFMKGSATPAQGRFKAFMYGLFIILLYTLPISVIIMITRIVGGEAVTADIFNWLATHWLPNIIFFVVFMIFAASFFGAFEITLPESLVNKSDRGADKGGILGVFFMALTLVLVSFSCTGPIVGTVLIKSTQGEFWTPMITMLAFSTAFALPFTVLALFPSLLKKFKQSGGGWLSSVKVVLGFIEIALGFKFLSVADQTYHWGLLDREIYLAIWIVTFSLLGLYLLGKIRFSEDEQVEHLSVPRLALAIGVFTFVVYMIPGMFGAPLKGLSGYLPPITTQDFVIGQNAGTAAVETSSNESKYDLHLPLGLTGYFTLEEGLAAAKASGKPVFVDITGHGCVNCREMESRVWSDPAVLKMLKNDYIVVALYTDDKTRLKEEDWVHADNGDVYKDLGRANSYIARTRFNVNAQPNYVLLSPDGEQLVPTRGYSLDIDGFVAFLQSGLDAMN